MRRCLIAFFVLLNCLVLGTATRAQNVPVYATGTLTPGHALVLAPTGFPGSSVVQDAGPALAGRFTELGITNDGLPFCIRDKATQHILCFGANSLGGGLISYNPIGSGSPAPLQINLNGTSYPFPPTGNGNVLGPGSSVIGQVAIFNNVGGTLLAATSTLTGIALNNGTINGSPIGATTPSTGAFTSATLTQALGLTNAGVFTNTQMNEYATSLLNGISPSTEFHTVQAGQFATEALTGGIAVPNASTVYQSNSVAAYATNASTTTNTVGVYSQIRALVNNAKIWGANFLASDNGFVSNFSVQENDCATLNVNSGCNGLSLNGANTVTPRSAVGVVVGFFDTPSAPGSLAKWTTGFATGPGVAQVGLSIGTASYTGSNIASQPIDLNYFTGSGSAAFYQLVVSSGGIFSLTNSTGASTAQLNIGGIITMPQSGSISLGADQDLASSGAGNVVLGSGNTLTNIQIGNTTASLTLAIANGGTAAKYVCTDSSNKVVLQAGAC